MPRRLLVSLFVAALVLTVLPAAAAAQTEGSTTSQLASASTQVTGLTVRQDDGAAILSWNPVEGAGSYEIERTPLDSDGAPAGDPAIVGIWRPDRTQWAPAEPELPTFADSGFELGGRFQWRVRPVIGAEDGPFSEPVSDDTLAPFGPEDFLTQFETSGGSEWTSHENEIDFADRLAAASDRVRVETVGHTVLGRRIDLWTFGYPAPLGTPEQISRTPTVLISGNVHGNEPAPREAAFLLARQLAFSDDPWVIDILSHATVLIVPTMNGDGRANDTRGNATGQDLNRDHSLLREPETFVFAEVMRDYTPDAVLDGHEFGNVNTGDLPLLWPRHRNVAPAIHDAAMTMVREHYFNRSPLDGWWTVPYPYPSVGAGLGQEEILRNTTGLKNMLGMLLETRVQAGPTRPDFSTTENMRRRVYSALWVFREFLTHHRERRSDVYDAIVGGREYNIANEGPVFLDGAYNTPQDTPIAHPPTRVLDPAPCGYRLTTEQYTGDRPDGPTVEQRLAAHGIRAELHDDGVVVRLHQPLRALVPLLLDPEAVLGMVAGERLDACPPPVCTGTVHLSGHDSGIDDRPVDDTFCLSHLFDGERPWPSHGRFVEHVSRTAGDMLAAGHISGRDRGLLVNTASGSWGGS